jgi:5-methylcytosine-specific restriction endonuclease McrA
METESNRRNGYHKVLVLNNSFQPINITSWRRAMVLLFKEKAEDVEDSSTLINDKWKLPYIIRLRTYVPIPFSEAVLSRKNIYLRDNHTCQYCGKDGGLTIDHIIPKSRGGKDSWDNMVACCMRCNNRKGDSIPEEAEMKLIRVPYRPPSNLYLHITRLSNIPECWYTYFYGKKKVK